MPDAPQKRPSSRSEEETPRSVEASREPAPGRHRHPLPDERWPSVEEAARSPLFSPLVLPSGLPLADRTWVPAMVPWRATEDGFVTPAVVDWYRRFAEGRPGVLVVEATGIRDVPSGPLLRIGHDRFLSGLRELVSAVRSASEGRTRLLIQIIDFLAIRRRPAPERYFREFLTVTDDHRERLAARDPHLDLADDRAVRESLLAAGEDGWSELLSPREGGGLRRGRAALRARLHDGLLPVAPQRSR